MFHEGRGTIGAVACLPFFAQPDESIKLDLINYSRSSNLYSTDVP
jgi:hypothetical protein